MFHTVGSRGTRRLGCGTVLFLMENYFFTLAQSYVFHSSHEPWNTVPHLMRIVWNGVDVTVEVALRPM